MEMTQINKSRDEKEESQQKFMKYRGSLGNILKTYITTR
jgi:hypothetical protein